MISVSDERFDQMVEAALAEIPKALAEQVENCAVLVVDEPDVELGDVLGLYEGIPLSERTTQYSVVLPDRITIFRGPLCRLVDSEAELVKQVRITVLHEVAHYFGIDHELLDQWGFG
jgi:predicted Zn-dependent protease with MMP-like domain